MKHFHESIKRKNEGAPYGCEEWEWARAKKLWCNSYRFLVYYTRPVYTVCAYEKMNVVMNSGKRGHFHIINCATIFYCVGVLMIYRLPSHRMQLLNGTKKSMHKNGIEPPQYRLSFMHCDKRCSLSEMQFPFCATYYTMTIEIRLLLLNGASNQAVYELMNWLIIEIVWGLCNRLIYCNW